MRRWWRTTCSPTLPATPCSSAAKMGTPRPFPASTKPSRRRRRSARAGMVLRGCRTRTKTRTTTTRRQSSCTPPRPPAPSRSSARGTPFTRTLLAAHARRWRWARRKYGRSGRLSREPSRSARTLPTPSCGGSTSAGTCRFSSRRAASATRSSGRWTLRSWTTTITCPSSSMGCAKRRNPTASSLSRGHSTCWSTGGPRSCQ
mmetsp:Transcript_53872/g.128062  ORF Transcript_53872/g.128062 Transcript_53872/m.128062 type:complete len:202 (-) Transcript_53872:400-1005(-)